MCTENHWWAMVLLAVILPLLAHLAGWEGQVFWWPALGLAAFVVCVLLRGLWAWLRLHRWRRAQE